MSVSVPKTRSLLALAAASGAVLVLFVWPLLLVFHAAWQGRDHAEPGLTTATQQVSLAAETTKLILLVLFVAAPVGVVASVAVLRTDLPGRWLWLLVILLPALLPLDLHATAWLAAIGPQGIARTLGIPIELKGLVGAAWVHAMPSIAWIVIFTAPALLSVEPELEEDCLLVAGPWRTIWHVTLRRSLGGIVAACLIVAVQTAGEMAVTDLLQVRTYAETIYTEFALASRIGAATATAVPGLFLWCSFVALAGFLLVRTVPQNDQALFARRRLFRLRSARLAALSICLLIAVTSIGLPVASLVWRTGLKFPRVSIQAGAGGVAAGGRGTALRSNEPRWSAAAFRENLKRSSESAGDQLTLSLKVAAVTAAVVVPAAWLLVSMARASTAGTWLLAGATCLLFAMPGPVVGIGIQLAMGHLETWWHRLGIPWTAPDFDREWFGSLPPWILVWLHSLRALPYAIALVWPVRRILNRRYMEAAAVDGAGMVQRFWYVELPAARSAVLAAALAASVLSLGELSGSVLVTPPGQQPLSVRIFTLAHYGLESHLAGICLLLLGVSFLAAAAAIACAVWLVRELRE